jgi:hypothetical protein
MIPDRPDLDLAALQVHEGRRTAILPCGVVGDDVTDPKFTGVQILRLRSSSYIHGVPLNCLSYGFLYGPGFVFSPTTLLRFAARVR